jgi:competence protein ComEC
MNIWHQYPLVRIYMAFASGIALAILLGSTELFWLPVTGIILILLIVSGINFKWSRNHKIRWLFGILANAFFFLLGYNLLILDTNFLYADHFPEITGSQLFVVLVDEPPLVTENTCKMVLRVKARYGRNGFVSASGRIMAYFSKDPFSAKIRYGDLLIIGSTPQPIEGPSNPGAFDYRRYLASNNVYHQVFLRKSQWKKLDSGQGSGILSRAVGIRDRFLEIFRENGIKGKEYAVASALILGSSDLLDPETRREYAGSGAMHILSVSGMHVAVIFVVLNTLLAFMDRRSSLKIAKAVLLVICIWFYAAITGLSPAVLRAAWMISLLIIGTTWKRQANIYNILAGSALLITFADPQIILNAGFQLSYVAVLGIVAVEPWIYRLWSPNRWITDWMWKVVAVSIAAQVATFPLAFYYFHQFANYFLLTNLVAIPISSFVIYSGIAVLLTSPVHFLSALLSKVMAGLLIAMNSSIRFIEQAPGSVSRDVPFSFLMLVLIYLVILVLFRLWVSRAKVYLYLSMTVLLLIAILNVVNQYHWQNQNQFVVYAVKNHTAFGFVSGREAVLFSDSAVAGDSALIGFTMRPHWVNSALKKISLLRIVNQYPKQKPVWLLRGVCIAQSNYYQFGKTRVAVISNKPLINQIGVKLNIDYLIIRNIKGLRIADICKIYSAGELIFDSSVPRWKSLKMRNECKQLGQKFFSVPAKGAFLANL